MLNNILNGYRPLITRLGVISLLAFCIAFLVTPGSAKETTPAPTPAPNYFEVPTKLVCGLTDDFIRGAKEAAEEQVFALGESDDDKNYIVSFWANFKTKTWTVAITDVKQPQYTCIMHTGKGLKFNVPGKYST